MKKFNDPAQSVQLPLDFSQLEVSRCTVHVDGLSSSNVVKVDFGGDAFTKLVERKRELKIETLLENVIADARKLNW